MPDRSHAAADHIEVLRQAREAIDRALVALGANTVIDTETPTPVDEPDWRKLKDAARICGVHPETMSRWARSHGLGRRIDGGEWRIDMARVNAWQEGRPYTRLSQDLSEDVDSCRRLSDAPEDGTAAYSPEKEDRK